MSYSQHDRNNPNVQPVIYRRKVCIMRMNKKVLGGPISPPTTGKLSKIYAKNQK